MMAKTGTIVYGHLYMKDNERIIYDSRLISAGEAVAPAHSRGLMYGDGLFETFRTYSAKTFLLEQHLKRLKEGLNLLKIPFPSDLAIENLKPLIFRLLKAKDLSNDDAIIRIQVWRDGERGYMPDTSANSHFSIIASKCPKIFKKPVLATVETRRIPSVALPSTYKFSNGINYILAANEAVDKGADDVLMQTTNGKISETTIANIFWIKGDKIFTPSIDCDLIPGITRSILIDLSADGLSLDVGEFELNAILEADAVFMTNSVREILPVKAVNDHYFDIENDIIKELKNRFVNFRDEHLKPLK
ncbi:MAG TPA: aminotransferase class IV [Balneolaceae bacterium]